MRFISDNMSKKQKKLLCRIIASAAFMIVIALLPLEGFVLFALTMIPYLTAGYDILIKAVRGIFNRQVFDENFLMAAATVGAIAIAVSGRGDYTEAVAVMIFYQTGELFQSYAVGKSRKSISELMDIRPDYANIMENGELVKADPDSIQPGSIIIVKPGEKIPIDGILVEGSTQLDTSALTGESMPRTVMPGDEVSSGCINMTGVIEIRTTKEFSDSTVAKILELVEDASANKSKAENFISRFAKYYTPAVCISAVALAVIPPTFSALLNGNPAWGIWLYRALTFLVVSCPCALVISIPLSFFAGIGGASREGILVKGSNFLEALSKIKYLVFDKTGTLTEGRFIVSGVYPTSVDEAMLIEYAALAESSSTHPISKSLLTYYGKKPDINRVSDVTEKAGKGVIAKVDGVLTAIGNSLLMEELGIDAEQNDGVIHVAIDSAYAGYIMISDNPKPDAASALSELKKLGIEKTVMLTGDTEGTAQKTALALGIDEYYSSLMPQDKVSIVEEYLAKTPKGSALAFVGDGINDAPVISRADIGIAMGGIGSDAAIEAADVVLMDDSPRKIAKAIKISKKCMGIVYSNTAFAIGIKLLCLLLTAAGMANMWLAIFADVGVMIIAVLNSMRSLNIKKI